MGGQRLSAVIDCRGGLKPDRRSGRTELFQAPLKLLAAVGPEVALDSDQRRLQPFSS
jgi:hypothetical protein